MDFATITATRDRPNLFSHCKWQLDRQTLQPKARYYIAYDPINEEMDLVRRIKSGIELAKRDGIDLVFIWEDDDSYQANHFERYSLFFNSYDFFGDDKTVYYSLKNKTYNTFQHPGRSSLFTTGFKISALSQFNWPSDNAKFLDLKIWDYARNRKKKFIHSGAIGIKAHGEGKAGGKGHIMNFPNKDSDLKFLKAHTDEWSFNFYTTLMLTL